MIVLSLEEFASRRRGEQERIEKVLLPIVVSTVNNRVNTHGYFELLEEVAKQWQIVYHDESGDGDARMPVSLRDDLLRTLRLTDRTRHDPHTPERIAIWLATTILSHATMTASADDPEELFMEWVDMGDDKVRHSHQIASGQQRPIGEKFQVDGHEMWGPGDPTVPIELWINCRCTLRPVLASEVIAAAIANAPEGYGVLHIPDKMRFKVNTESEAEFLAALTKAMLDPINEPAEPTHAGLAVYATDSGRILMLQRAWDETDAPDVRGTWEFPGGGIEQGESPEEGARREFSEETGCPVPQGEITNGWRSENGVYQGFVLTVPVETEAFTEINPDAEAVDEINPDDPDRRNPDVTAWFTIQQIKDLGSALRPEVAKTDWSVFDGGDDMSTTTDEKPDLSTPEGEEPKFTAETGIPFFTVLAPEGVWSGDRRKFKEGSLSHRPLPLPITWQKTSMGGHDGNVTVARLDRAALVDGEYRGTGMFLATPEADETVGLLADFGRFGISVDADSVTFEINEEEEGTEFSAARISSACIVAIPAFAEAYIALGEAPPGFLPEEECKNVDEEGNCLDEKPEPTPEGMALIAADVAPGITEDGPGWLTHPVDTDRLRDYWVRGPGAAKIAWGTPGDFNRCRVNVAEYVKPQYLNGYCANRHFDALGTWPGPASHASEIMTDTEPAEALNLVASNGHCAPSAWFEDPKFTELTPMSITEDGQVFGHIAGWKTCHSSFADKCVTPPRSKTGYAYYRLGSVLTDKGEVPTGSLTIGGGHANGRLGLRAAIEHYDNSTAVFADVAAGEDEFGIWFAGWIRPGTSPEMIHAARASKLSGDWRRNLATNSMEMIAALAVNTPGFAIPRVAASVEGGEQISLVAAGAVVAEEGTQVLDLTFDYEAFAVAIAEQIDALHQRRAAMTELSAGLEATMERTVEQRKEIMAGLAMALNERGN